MIDRLSLWRGRHRRRPSRDGYVVGVGRRRGRLDVGMIDTDSPAWSFPPTPPRRVLRARRRRQCAAASASRPTNSLSSLVRRFPGPRRPPRGRVGWVASSPVLAPVKRRRRSATDVHDRGRRRTGVVERRGAADRLCGAVVHHRGPAGTLLRAREGLERRGYEHGVGRNRGASPVGSSPFHSGRAPGSRGLRYNPARRSPLMRKVCRRRGARRRCSRRNQVGRHGRRLARSPSAPSGYLVPAKAIVDVLDAPPPPTVELSASGTAMAVLERAEHAVHRRAGAADAADRRRAHQPEDQRSASRRALSQPDA